MIKARIANAEDGSERRRDERIPVDIEGKVRELGMEGSEARVLNLSESGFMAETTAAFDVGARVWLIIPGRERASAVVRWTAGHRLGAEFAEPVSLDGVKD
ncbi:PilZ domain-containing protein [Sphingomonas sp. HDW15A]|uniref:PilZ domain-containing protein n=1 Tax=Sphingomonas sp. HDW15A TaxID=2714942 RepID=UPI00140BBA57|nr:PilZ domain-containing protein [Sphingomonas sp. HDW15A]QIK95126.1 PilZ domain-containing protein [Sphingomonas sp. HDW15A]